MVEYMNDYSAIINQDPGSFGQTFHMKGFDLILFQMFNHRVGDRPDMPVRIAVHQEKIIRDVRQLSDIQN